MDPDHVVRHDADNHRYVVEVDGQVVGFTEYHLRGGRHFFVHTEIDPEHEGRGLATSLVREALDDVRSHGGSVVPLCPYVAAFIRRHPDYEDLIDHEMMKRIDHAHEA
ncbi:MAG: N-acetyltransferase [Actinobacteria bacterium]|nr:N-acetyltransferase [Actinomycetota bacterium]